MPKTSIIIPTYNEEASIEKVIGDLKVYLNHDCEIIVVDDGSTDNTLKLIEKIPDIKIVRHLKNKGYGAALKTGIQKSQGEYILIIDADGSYPPESITKLIEQKDSYDMVVGARTSPQSQIPALRKPAKWVLNRLANYLTGIKIPDLNSGLRIIKKDPLLQFIRILPNGFSFTTTITLAFLTNGYQVNYFPINYYKRKGKSKIKPIRDTLNFLKLIFKAILYFSPLKVFVPFSLIILALAMALAIYSIALTPKFMDTAFIVLCATALQTFFFGLLAEIIVRTKK
jgi:glycosyltransferase involved in cell wall biosynthesis